MAKSSDKTSWALTLTLKPKWYKNKPKPQLIRVLLNDFFKELQNTSVCELTKKMNIHVHSLIKFVTDYKTGEVELLISNLLRDNELFGFYDLKPLIEKKDEEKWIEYMFKNIDTTIRLTDCYRPHPRDDYKLCPCNYNMLCAPVIYSDKK